MSRSRVEGHWGWQKVGGRRGGLGAGGLGVGVLGVGGQGVDVGWVSCRHRSLSRAMVLHVEKSLGRPLCFVFQRFLERAA
jgi:hypothetical protein